MADPDLLAQASLYLPKYLTPAQKKDLYSELESFPAITSFYLPPGTIKEDLLQGDGWRGFLLISFETLERKVVSGLLLSNSCDIDVRNPRVSPRNLLFAPLIPLAKYETLLKAAGVSDIAIGDMLDSIRKQLITDIFYLPDAPYGPGESIVMLDNIHTQPLDVFLSADRKLLFRLNQTGFYILLIKISIHFSRFQEGVQRFPLRSA